MLKSVIDAPSSSVCWLQPRNSSHIYVCGSSVGDHPLKIDLLVARDRIVSIMLWMNSKPSQEGKINIYSAMHYCLNHFIMKLNKIQGEYETWLFMKFISNEGVESRHIVSRKLAKLTTPVETPNNPNPSYAIMAHWVALEECWQSLPSSHPFLNHFKKLMPGYYSDDDDDL